MGANTGATLWRTRRGAFHPAISDGRRIYFNGYSSLFGLDPKGVRFSERSARTAARGTRRRSVDRRVARHRRYLRRVCRRASHIRRDRVREARLRKHRCYALWEDIRRARKRSRGR
jgi:hypothetical protein